MSTQRRGRGRVNVRRATASGIPSPLGQSHASSSSSMSPGTMSPPSTPSGEDTEQSAASSELRKRKWSSPVWRHYDVFDGKNYEDGKPRAICKYCKGGPLYANSGLGTSNFKRHTESCHARTSGHTGEMVPGKDGLLIKKIDQFHYKEKVALTIIRHGYPFTYAEHEGNRDLHSYLNDNVKFMSRNTAKNYCMKIHKREKKKLKEELGKVKGKICLTCDMWTSCVDQGYLSLTAHYVDNDWSLHAKILNFYHLEPPHDALSIHGKLLEFIKGWEITKKFFTITLDNARCNDNMRELLAASLKVHSPLHRDGKFFHVRCGAHILNLIVKKLVTYICCSERRTMKFEENVIASGLDHSKGLYMECPTRWNSTYKMLFRALHFRDAFMSMSLSSRYDVTFPPLPTPEEWHRIGKICSLLKPFDEITTIISGRKYPTSNLYLKCVWKIKCLLLEYGSCEDEFLSEMARIMKVKFDKYWESYSLILSFAAVLDPRFKFQFVRHCFTELDAQSAEIKSNQVKIELYKLFEEYVRMDPTVNANSQPTRIQDEFPGFAAFANDVNRVSNTQLDLYLEDTRVDHTLEIDVLTWWQENESRYPIVATMAREILAIPVTTVASESSFSMGSRLITKWRSSLKPEIADALLTTRTWLYGFEVKDGTNENPALDGFEYQFSTMRINDDASDDTRDNDDEDNDADDEDEEGLHINNVISSVFP
ncbi:hypothetical protein RND81_04G139500 [Saponaria officinalis]|uniref:BED-type domain-containing protein n=1 Tax=Saponaria officinalis TaxID=3572 RepID=A0AAW1LPC6_SAPOF